MTLRSPAGYRLLSPIGMIGYGIVEESLVRGLAARPDVIGADGGSVDAGPYYLGSGESFTSAPLVTRDLRLCLRGARELGVPLVVGTAGGSGAERHLEFALGCLRAAASAERASPLRVALVHAEQPRERVQRWVSDGRTSAFSGGPAPDAAAVAECERIVAQMGISSVARALEEEPDVVLAGRASDVAIFAGPAVRAGGDTALAVHLGKVIECGAHCAEPASGRDGILAVLHDDDFELVPTNPRRRCTPEAVAAHMLYENTHPFRLAEPEGVCDLSDTVVEPVDERTVRASGARFEPADRLTVKLEGAAPVGFRSIVLGGMRDPRLVAEIDHVVEAVEEAVRESLGDDDYRLAFRVYGRDGVLGDAEPDREFPPHELGVLCEALAPTSELAHAVGQAAEAALITASYRGGISATGNLAVPFSPLVVDTGRAYEWRVFCLAEPDEDEAGLFPVEVVAA